MTAHNAANWRPEGMWAGKATAQLSTFDTATQLVCALRGPNATGSTSARATVEGIWLTEGGTMIRIQLQYDRYSGTFILVNREYRSILQDGALYDLELCVSLDDQDPEDATTLDIGPLAHA